MRPFLFVLGSLLILGSLILGTSLPDQTVSALGLSGGLPPIVFVARAHLATEDDILDDELGPAGQFGTGLTKYAPGSKLVRRNPDGSLFLYNTPGLVDVQSPDISFDGTKIVFAGATTLIPGTTNSGWRLYEINVDGTGFHQLTFSDRDITIPNAALWGNQETYGTYSDLFPAFLADGRIAFVSTRYPTRAHYDQRASTNLYIMNNDGSGLHRVSTERAGLLHPTPLPDGRILVSRWWNQFNQPSNQGIYNRIDNRPYNQTLPDGTVIYANEDETFNPATGYLPGGYEIRDAPNTWHLMTLNPDGTDFKRFAWTPAFTWAITLDDGLDTYQASQPAVIQKDGKLHIAFTMQTDGSMVHSTQYTGIRVALTGIDMMYANTFDSIAGLSFDKAWNQDDDSGPYALHPWGLPDGTILYSQSTEDNSLPTTGQHTEGGHVFALQGSYLRYHLYTMNLDGTNKTLIPVNLNSIGLGTADVMDAKPVVARVGWSSIADQFTDVPADNPDEWNVPNTLAEYWFSNNGSNDIQTATIHNPNVYANPSLYTPFANNSPPPGSVAFAELWVDANQFTGAYCYNDWPDPCANFKWDNQVRAVLWDTAPVDALGAFTMTVPADTMGFIFLRDANGNAVSGWNRGYISIAQGSSWARPGETVTCVGCHMGHVSGSLDDVMIEAGQGWTNVAPYASVTASSYHEENNMYQPFNPVRVVDRRGWVPLPAGGPVTDPNEPYADDETGWMSELDKSAGQWVELNWPADMLVKSILLVGPPSNGGDWGGFGEPAQYGDYYVESGTLNFYLDGSLVKNQPVGRVEPLEDGGTLITFANPIESDRLRFTINSIFGSWYWSEVAGLNEIEVIGMAAEPWPLLTIFQTFIPMIEK